MAVTDVEIFGAGIFGLSIAYACLKRGATARVVERRAVGGGASGGFVGALAPHVPENWDEKKEFQLKSLAMSESFWKEVDGMSGGGSGYKRSGRVQPLVQQTVRDLTPSRSEAAKTLWRGVAAWEGLDENPCPGWCPESPIGHWVRDTLSARINPRGACESLAGAIASLGGEIITGAAEGRGARGAVLATGHEGLAELGSELGREMGIGVKGQALLLKLDAGDLPQVFFDGVHIVPHGNGTVAVGSTDERVFDSGHETDEKLDSLFQKAAGFCPALGSAEILERWAGVRARSNMRSPLLGAHPEKPGAFVANGGFKIGLGVAPLVGEVMADLALEGVDNIPASFKVERCFEKGSR